MTVINPFETTLNSRALTKKKPSFNGDSDAPLPFIEWRRQTLVATEQEASNLYNQYLSEWFQASKNNSVTIDQKFLLRQKYLYLLAQLKLFFTNEEKQSWYSKINLADEKELLLSIPFFAKKLKSIALYYQNLRKKLKNAKIKYNLAGSSGGIEKEIQQYLLELFASMEEDVDPALRRALPSYDAVKDSLKVEIEELYDGTTYFDRSTTMPVSAYVDLFHESTAKLFQTKGLTLSSDEWVFNTFSVPVTSNLTTYVNQITGLIFEQTDPALYYGFVSKYLTGNRIVTNFAVPSAEVVFKDISITKGDNYFYYPYGSVNEVTDTSMMVPVALSSLNLVGTAGDALSTADIIHVRYGDVIKSAWLHERIYDATDSHVAAKINGKTSTKFMFPYPGVGMSAEDIPWTGKSLSSTSEFKYLTREYKNAVTSAYWLDPLSGDSCIPIPINNSTLTDCGAFPSVYSDKADTIYLRESNGADQAAPFTSLSSCWLYRFERTSIPIHVSLTDPILWPYQYVSATEDLFPPHLKTFNYDKRCATTVLNDINKSNLVAGSAIDLGEKVYKLGRYTDNKTTAMECAWLSGSSNESETHKWISQDGFTGLFEPGQATRFLWTGVNKTPLSGVFKTLSHSEECPFTTSKDPEHLGGNQCTCKQVYYTPRGHPGEIFSEHNSQADFIVKEIIVEDSDNTRFSSGIEPFTGSTWVDENGLTITETNKFAWYKTDSVIGGYGDGKWVGNQGRTPLVLETGSSYFYVRAASRTSALSAEDPCLVVNYDHSLPKKNTKWIQAKLDIEGNWISTDVESTISIDAGDFVIWEHPEVTTNYLLSTVEVENVSENTGNIWASLDVLAYNTPLSTAIITWPVEVYGSEPEETKSLQYPKYSFVDVLSVTYWKFKNTTTNKTYTFSATDIMTFAPPTTGVYDISVRAMIALSGGESGLVVNIPGDGGTTIPPLTVIPQFESTKELVPVTQPVPGALLEIPLSGWNYETNKYDGKSLGAAPYWAEKHVSKSPSTNFGGLFDWGYSTEFIERYLPNATPHISNLTINYGHVLEYKSLSSSFVWNQPIEFQTFVGVPLWCKIQRNENSYSPLSATYDILQYRDTHAKPTLSASDILLSNYIDGSPLEVFYQAANSFTWTVKVDTLSSGTVSKYSYTAIGTDQSHNVLSNRNYPTIAVIPIAEDVYSKKDVGGFFVPNNLGASNYVNRNYTVKLSTDIKDGSEFFASELNPAGGRGLTKQQQQVPYYWEDDNQWLKAPFNSGVFAGSVRKSLTKDLQTFVPYQESLGLSVNGLVTPESRTSPWGGVEGTEWTDTQNFPKTFAGVPNVPAWTKTQILKYTQQEVDCWTSDIYSNQYGLYKSLSASVVTDRSETTGELWVKTKEGNVITGTAALSSIYEPFKVINSTVYSQLTGSGICVVDCFGDVVFIQTTNAVIFAKILFDPETLLINTTLDDTRFIITSLNIESDERLDGYQKLGQTWYSPKNKTVDIAVVSIYQNQLFPEIHKVHLSPMSLDKAFPSTEDQTTTLTQELSSISAKSVESALLTYNEPLRKYAMTISGTTTNEKPFVVNLILQHENS